MTRKELGMFEDDPRSVAGANAINELMRQMSQEAQRSSQRTVANSSNNIDWETRWGLDPDSDPRVVATRAAIEAERTFDAYSTREAWTMNPGEEVDLQNTSH
jgi:hypothetical protein